LDKNNFGAARFNCPSIIKLWLRNIFRNFIEGAGESPSFGDYKPLQTIDLSSIN